MKRVLADYLLEVHTLLRDKSRFRGLPPGMLLEQDIEDLAVARALHSERRTRTGAYGGAYYSGLAPETDLFVYNGSEFLHIEAKDTAGGISRAVPTEFWARALDLHLARSFDTLADACRDHYPVLVAASEPSDAIRGACLRWGICLVEPGRVPLPAVAQAQIDLEDCLRRALCSRNHVGPHEVGTLVSQKHSPLTSQGA